MNVIRKITSKWIVAIMLISMAILGIITTSQVKAYDDIYTGYKKVNFTGGGSCTLYSTLIVYGNGNHGTMNTYYQKSPRTNYTIYTQSITKKCYESKEYIQITGGSKQVISSASSSTVDGVSYTDMSFKLTW